MKSKLSTAKKSKTAAFSRVFDNFSRKIKVEFLDKKWTFRTVCVCTSWKGGRNLELVLSRQAKQGNHVVVMPCVPCSFRRLILDTFFSGFASSSCIFCVKVGVAYFSWLLRLVLYPGPHDASTSSVPLPRCSPLLTAPPLLREFSNASAVTTSTSDGPVAGRTLLSDITSSNFGLRLHNFVA